GVHYPADDRRALVISVDGLTTAWADCAAHDACLELGKLTSDPRGHHAALLRVNPRRAPRGHRCLNGPARSPKPTPPARGIRHVLRESDWDNDSPTLPNDGRLLSGRKPGWSSGSTSDAGGRVPSRSGWKGFWSPGPLVAAGALRI